MCMEIKKWNDGTEYIWYEDKDSGYASLPEGHMKKIVDHVTKYLGKHKEVIHETDSKYVHMDVIPVILQDKYPYNILVTMGMSAKPMNVHPESDASRYAELVIILPKNWKLNSKYWHDKKYFWPISAIRHLGVFPPANNTFFGYGHTISNGDPTDAYAENTELCYMFFDKPRIFPKEFSHLKIDDKKQIDFLCLIPIYKEEFEFKNIVGADALVHLFKENNISQALDIDRKNVCKGFMDNFENKEKSSREEYKNSKKNINESIQLLKNEKYDQALNLFEKSLLERGGHYVYPDEIHDFLLAATELILTKRKERNNDINESFSKKIKEHWFGLALHHECDYDEYERAAECADQALKITEDIDPMEGELAARAYSHTQQYEKEIYVCDLVLKDNPTDDYLLESKVDALRKTGKFKDAVQYLDKLLKQYPKGNPLLEDWRIGLLNLNEKHKKALIEVNKKLKKYPNHSDCLYEKAYALYKLGNVEESIETLKKSIEKTNHMESKRMANSIYFLGYIFATSLIKYEDALKYLNKAIELNSSDKNIKKTRDIIEKINNKEESEEIIKKDIPKYEHFFWF